MSKFIFKRVNDQITIENKAEYLTEFPAGIYNIGSTMNGIFFSQVNLISDEIIPVENSPTDEIINDINNFMSVETQNKYKEYGFVHKRGILMYGRGGTGKSTTITQVANNIVNRGGIVFFNAPPTLLAAVLPTIRQNNPNKIIGVIYEEFDEWLAGESAAMLSFLDGELQVNNIVFLGATNYISKIPERIKNRPSRFSKVIEITAPDINFRREFFKCKLKGDDLNRLDEFVTNTEGMVVDQLKDIIISVCCIGLSLSDAINKIKSMEKNGVGVDDYRESYQQGELKSFADKVKRIQKQENIATIVRTIGIEKDLPNDI